MKYYFLYLTKSLNTKYYSECILRPIIEHCQYSKSHVLALQFTTKACLQSDLCRAVNVPVSPSLLSCTVIVQNSMQDLKFNTTTSCLSPLVPTKNKLAFYPTVEGCAPPCQGLLYSAQERQEVHRFVHVFGGLSFALTLLTVVCDAVWDEALLGNDTYS